MKFPFEWWYFRRIKPKLGPIGEKTMFQGPYGGGETTPEIGRAGGVIIFLIFLFFLFHSPISILHKKNRMRLWQNRAGGRPQPGYQNAAAL